MRVEDMRGGSNSLTTEPLGDEDSDALRVGQ